MALLLSAQLAARQQQPDLTPLQEAGDVQPFADGVNLTLAAAERHRRKTMSRHPVRVQSAITDE